MGEEEEEEVDCGYTVSRCGSPSAGEPGEEEDLIKTNNPESL